MAAETDGYALPASRPSVTDAHVVLTERQRIELKTERAEIEAAERAEREERERPIRESEAEVRRAHRDWLETVRLPLLATVKDANAFSDPALRGVVMSHEDADAFNLSEFGKFRLAHPDVWLSPELLGQFGSYFEKNGLRLISAVMLDALIERFRDAALLPERPRPTATVAVPQPHREELPKVVTYEGIDLETGLPRNYNEREVNRMSADQMKRCLQLSSDRLSLPNLGPGPKPFYK